MMGAKIGNRIGDALSGDETTNEVIDPTNPRDYEIPAIQRKQAGQAPLTRKDIEQKDRKAEFDFYRRAHGEPHPDDTLDEFLDTAVTVSGTQGTNKSSGSSGGAGVSGVTGGSGGSATSGAQGGSSSATNSNDNDQNASTKSGAAAGRGNQVSENDREENSPLAGQYGHSGKMKPVSKDLSFLDRLKELSGMKK